MLILEDDVIIPKNFKQIYSKYITHVPLDWDIIFLGGNRIMGRKINSHVIAPITSRKIIRRKKINNYNYGFFGYIINSAKIKKIIDICTPLRFTIDTHLKNLGFPRLKVYYIIPTIIKHDYQLVSTIRNISRENDSLRNNKVTIIEDV